MTTDSGNLSTFYNTLFGIQVTVMGFAIAGLIALWQWHDRSIPKRDFSVIISRPARWTLFTIQTLAVIFVGMSAWVSSVGQHNLLLDYDLHSVDIVMHPVTSMLVLFITTGTFFYFCILLWRSQRVLFVDKYFIHYIAKLSMTDASGYLFHKYSLKPLPYFSSIILFRMQRNKDKKSETLKKQEAKAELEAWEKRYQLTENLEDPFKPIVLYCKFSITQFDDSFVSIGLNSMENLLSRVIEENKEDLNTYTYLTRHLTGIVIELNEQLNSAYVSQNKALIDVLKVLAFELIRHNRFDDLKLVGLTISDQLKNDAPDEEYIAAINALREITDQLISESNNSEWDNIEEYFDNFTLYVARVAEKYYLGSRQLSSIPIIARNQFEYDDVSETLANYFASYESLRTKHKNYYPLLYFDAIDVTIDAMMYKVAEWKRSDRSKVGHTHEYDNVLTTLHFIPYEFALASIESKASKAPQIVGLSLLRLFSMIHKAKQFVLEDTVREICENLIHIGFKLAISGITVEYLSGDALDRIADEVIENIRMEDIQSMQSSLQHDLLTEYYDSKADRLKQKLGLI